MRIRDIVENHAQEFIDCIQMRVNNYPIALEDDETDRIDKAFQKHMPKLNKSMILYRGIGRDSNYWDDNYQVGNIVEFGDYVSASTNPKTAMKFVLPGGVENLGEPHDTQILLVIRTKPGVRGIDVRQFVNIKNFTNTKHEDEIILNKNAKFRVVKRGIKIWREYENRKIHVIHLQQIS